MVELSENEGKRRSKDQISKGETVRRKSFKNRNLPAM